jgi:hypothetical protein
VVIIAGAVGRFPNCNPATDYGSHATTLSLWRNNEKTQALKKISPTNYWPPVALDNDEQQQQGEARDSQSTERLTTHDDHFHRRRGIPSFIIPHPPEQNRLVHYLY